MKRQLTVIICILMVLSCLVLPCLAQNSTPQIDKEAVLAALYEADISSLRMAIDQGLVTSVELTQYYLDRIDAYDDPYNCFITICDDALDVAAMRDAELAEGGEIGVLHGIPIVIKDNMDLTGFHTTNGLRKTDSQIAKSNADVVDYLLEEGAVIIAKANMSTEAQDALRSLSKAAGETKNAYNHYLAAGGSSGGSAVSTSLNFTAASLGTDTNSSLRIPAALAGCVSLRPTFGSISVGGIKRLNSTRDVPGAITRTVYDQAIMLDVLTQGIHNYTDNLNGDALKGMRIGVLTQLSYAVDDIALRNEKNIDSEVAAAFENAIAELRNCGAEVVNVSMPKLFRLSDKTFKNNKQSSKLALYEEFQRLLDEENISAVIYPTYLSTPLRSGKDADGKNWNVYDQTNINNCRTLAPSAGIPEITVPIGVHSLGAGIGMEIAAAKNCEQLLLDIAYSYTSRYNHRQIPTGAPNEYADHSLGTLADLITLSNTPAVPAETSDNAVLITDDSSNNLPVEPRTRNFAEYWPFVLLGVLLVLLVIAVRELRIRRRRKRRKARRNTPIAQ